MKAEESPIFAPAAPRADPELRRLMDHLRDGTIGGVLRDDAVLDEDYCVSMRTKALRQGRAWCGRPF